MSHAESEGYVFQKVMHSGDRKGYLSTLRENQEAQCGKMEVESMRGGDYRGNNNRVQRL